MTVTAVVTVVKVVSSGIPLEKTKLAVIATLEVIEYGSRISKRRQFVTMHKGNSMNPLLKVIQF